MYKPSCKLLAYAFFVQEFEQNEAQLRHIIDTFKLIDNGYA